MLQVNDTVLYKNHGVCTISEITEKNFYGTNIEYYVLRPRQNSETAFYVPTGNPDLVAQMRRIYSAKEMYELIRTIPSAELLSFDEEDDQKEACKDILKSGDREKIIQLMKTLYTREQKLKEKGKKLRQFEEHALKEAESLLYEELSYVFSLKKEQVLPFITEQIQLNEKAE